MSLKYYCIPHYTLLLQLIKMTRSVPQRTREHLATPLGTLKVYIILDVLRTNFMTESKCVYSRSIGEGIRYRCPL